MKLLEQQLQDKTDKMLSHVPECSRETLKNSWKHEFIKKKININS